MADAASVNVPADGSARSPILLGDGMVRRQQQAWNPTTEERWLVQRVEQRMPSILSHRWAMERVWFENVLFDLGIQWLDWNPSARAFAAFSAPKWFPRPVTNMIYPRRERLVSQYLKSPAVARVRPNTSDPSDREAARAGEQILGHVDDVVDEETLSYRHALNLVLTGTTISKEWFNPRTGPIVQVPEFQLQTRPVMQDVASCPSCGYADGPEQAGMPCPNCGENQLLPHRQQQMLGGTPAYDLVREPVMDPTSGTPLIHRYYLGEIQSEVITPFEFYADPRAQTLREAEWCGHMTYRELEWVDRNFPEMAPFVGEESRVRATGVYQAALLQMVGQSIPGMQVNAGLLRGGCLVKCYEEMPSQTFPDGLAIITAGQVLLYAGPLPIDGELSYALTTYSPVLGRLWGTTPIEMCVPLQRRLNGIDCQIIINRKTILNPWILAPKGSGLKPGQVALRPAAVVEYNHMNVGAAPQIVPGTPLPAQIMEERNQILEAIETICATQDVLRGDVPPGVKSGIALSFLGEQAETTHMPRARRWESFKAERGRKRLLLAQKYYREPRMVKILGQGSGWQVRALQGADLRNNTDVVVESGSSLPRSRTAQIQLIFDALQQGLLGQLPLDPATRQKILEDVGLVGYETEIGPDRRRALMENALMDEGQVPQVGPYENKAVHLMEHLLEQKDPRFDTKTPQAQRAYLMHIQATRQAFIAEMAQEMNAPAAGEAPAPGGEPPPPGAPGPEAPPAPPTPSPAPPS